MCQIFTRENAMRPIILAYSILHMLNISSLLRVEPPSQSEQSTHMASERRSLKISEAFVSKT